jgi:adenosylcobinamide-phosphate synthase
MAAMAGLLGVCLEKPGHYRLGDARGAVTAEDIGRAWRIVAIAAMLAGGLFLAISPSRGAHGV